MEPVFLKAEYDEVKDTSSNFKYSLLPTRAVSSGKDRRQGFGPDVF